MLISVPSGTSRAVIAAAAEAGVHATGILVEPDGHGLEQLAALVDQGSLQVHVGSVVPLERVADAHRVGEEGRSQGKIVLSVVES
jgi:NADPH:quinone reductase-like Zn-dependent oxidoreductase